MGDDTEVSDVEKLERRMNDRIDGVEKLSRDNSIAIGQLTVNVDHLTKSTQGIVDVWSAGRTIQAVVKWLSGFSFIAVIVAWFTGKLG